MIKNKNLVLWVLSIAIMTFLFAGCSGGSDNEAEENDNKEEVKTEKEADSKEEKSGEEQEESETTVSLEDRNYKVEEFNNLYNENKDGLKGQTVTIEGFYMNYNKQKDANSDDEEYEYNMTLYTDDSFDHDAAQVFFNMKENNKEQFKGIKQKDKITVKGKITGEEFFDAPRLEEGVIVK